MEPTVFLPKTIYLVSLKGHLYSCVQEPNPEFSEKYARIYRYKYVPNQISENPDIPFISDTRTWKTCHREKIERLRKYQGLSCYSRLEILIEDHGEKNVVRGDVYNLDELEKYDIYIVDDASKRSDLSFMNDEEFQEDNSDFWKSIPKYAENEDEHLKLLSPFLLKITNELYELLKMNWKIKQIFDKPIVVNDKITYITEDIRNKYNTVLII